MCVCGEHLNGSSHCLEHLIEGYETEGFRHIKMGAIKLFPAPSIHNFLLLEIHSERIMVFTSCTHICIVINDLYVIQITIICEFHKNFIFMISFVIRERVEQVAVLP